MFDKLLFLFLILSPICYAGGEDLYIYADRFLMIGTIILGCVSFLYCEPKRRLIPSWPVWLVLLACLKLYLLPYHPLCIHSVLNIFCAVGLFYLTANYAEDIRWVYRAIGIVLCLNMVFGIMNFFGYNPIFKYEGLPAGFFSDNTDMSGYFILTTPLMARYGRGFGFFAPFIFAISLLQSFSVVICSGIAAMILTLRKGFYPMAAIIVVGLGITAFAKINSVYTFLYKLGYRLPLWQEAVKGALRKPLTGYGLGRAIEFTKSIDQGSFTFKSDYLEFAFEVGAAVALIAIGYIGWELIKRYRQTIETWELKILSVALVSFLISIIGQSHLRNPKISPTFMVLLAFFYILTEKKGKSDVI